MSFIRAGFSSTKRTTSSTPLPTQSWPIWPRTSTYWAITTFAWGNHPDARLSRFITDRLVSLLPEARERFDRFRDLLEGYTDGEYDYASFSARVRRRSRGEPEDGELEREDQDDGLPWDEPEPEEG